MNAEVVINLTKYHVDFSQSLDISIPIIFNGEQPNTYGVAKASSVAYQDNKFIGDRRKGGPCNFETYNINEVVDFVIELKDNMNISECVSDEILKKHNVKEVAEENKINSVILNDLKII